MRNWQKLGWEVSGKIGWGQCSDVYKVVRKSHVKEDDNGVDGQKVYALKIVDPDDVRPPHNIRNEIKILKDMKRSQEKGGRQIPYVITLEDDVFNNQEYGLVFPFLELNLYDVVKGHIKQRSRFNLDGTVTQTNTNTMTIEDVKTITTGLLRGLDWIHSQGVIHRDINPNNILFAKNDTNTPVIIDFGIAFQEPDNNGLEPPQKKYTDIATGVYKAPELLLSKRDYSNKVDMWALGMLLTLLLSKDGEPLFGQDAMHSDLVLLSSILTYFGSPPANWSDCQGLSSFDSLNSTFFTKTAKQTHCMLPRLYNSTLEAYDTKLEELFVGLTRYETKARFSAKEALDLLC